MEENKLICEILCTWVQFYGVGREWADIDPESGVKLVLSLLLEVHDSQAEIKEMERRGTKDANGLGMGFIRRISKNV